MVEINKIKPNGLTVVSTFSGCGGSCLGFRMAGYTVLWANEFIEAARETYAANHSAMMDPRDIREITPESILKAIGKKAGEVDVLEGSPPCSSFSTAGRREKGWGKVKSYSDTAQRSDDLFFEYVRILRGIKPKVFVAENVSGLVKGTAKGYFLEILAAMKESGYRVACRVVDAQWLGVPQQRQRTIFIGVRDDLNIDPVHPTPLPYRYSVRDALPWIERIEEGVPHPTSSYNAGRRRTRGADETAASITTQGIGAGRMHAARVTEVGRPGRVVQDMHGTYKSAGDITDRPAPTIPSNAKGRSATQFVVEEVEPETNIDRFAIAAEYDKLKQGEQSDKYFSLVRVDEQAPCPTIQASHGQSGIAQPLHPTQRRKFTIAELKRICAFPDDFVLTGSYAQQWERLGRSVPPVMMAAIAATIRDKILL